MIKTPSVLIEGFRVLVIKMLVGRVMLSRVKFVCGYNEYRDVVGMSTNPLVKI